MLCLFLCQCTISIHALVKRATIAFQLVERYHSISIHALVKRATMSLRFVGFAVAISIHALVKRATYMFSRNRPSGSDFNPRPREEGDP